MEAADPQIYLSILILYIIKYGIGNPIAYWEDLSMYQIIRNLDYYDADLFATQLIPFAGPITQYLFQYVFDIPFAHFLIGLVRILILKY